MAGFKSTYLSSIYLNWLYNAAAPPSVSSLYYALFTTAPTISTPGTEVAGGSYARVPVARNTTNFPTTSTATISNATAIAWAAATANWGTVVGVGIFDAASGGNLLCYGPLGSSQAINSGSTFSLPATTGQTATEA